MIDKIFLEGSSTSAEKNKRKKYHIYDTLPYTIIHFFSADFSPVQPSSDPN